MQDWLQIDVLHYILGDLVVIPQNINVFEALHSAQKFTYFIFLKSFGWRYKAALRMSGFLWMDIMGTSLGKQTVGTK